MYLLIDDARARYTISEWLADRPPVRTAGRSEDGIKPPSKLKFEPRKAFKTSMKSSVILLASFVVGALGHARITSPTARKSGPVSAAACGAAVTKSLTTDETGPLEDAVQKIDSSYNAEACHLYFCRGYSFDDNKSNVKLYPPGTVVPIHIDLVAHHTGYANVSVVDLTTQKTIGTPLMTWPVYANSSVGPANWPANETDFSITIPSTLGSACQTAGKCAIQWWWYAAYSNKQTYMNCIDFTTV